jgi:hypothetical protein
MASQLPVAVGCRVLGAPRSSLYARRASASAGGRSGPATSISDRDLVELIRQVLDASPFAGEGYRKVRARLGRERGVHVSGNGCCACSDGRGCGRPSGSGAAANPARMTARSSLRHPTSAGAPTPPWPGPAATAGWGSLSAWTTPPPRPGPTWPRSVIASPPSSPSTMRSSTAGSPGGRHRPRTGAAARLGTPVSLGPLHRLAGLAGHR